MPVYSRAAFLASAATTALVPLAARAQSLTPLRATSAIDDAATPFLWAIDSGLFKRNGFDASLERSTSGAAAASAVLGGSFDVGKASTISFLSAHMAGLPLIAIAPAGEFNPKIANDALAVKSDSTIRTGADLNGKTIAVSAIKDLFSVAVLSWVDAHGGDSSTVKLLELPMSSVTLAIVSGRIDAAVLIQPFLSQALQDGSVKSIGDPASALGNHHLDSLWFTTIAYAKQNPDAVDRFMRTIREAAKYVNGHHAETSYLLTKFAMVKAGDVGKLRMLQGMQLDSGELQPLIDAAAKYKVISARFDAKDVIYQNALR
jgi:NitT/TauT family transport system substrate-binding protein